MKRLVYTSLCFLLGALYGWAGDGGHVWAGVLEYNKDERLWPPGLAWWVLPQFGLGGVVLDLLVGRVHRRWNGPLPPALPSYKRGACMLAASLGTYLLSSLLSAWDTGQLVISATLLALTLAEGFLLRLHKVSTILFAAVALAVGAGGVFYESFLCSAGAFRYVAPTPGMWVNAWIAFLWIGAMWPAAVLMFRWEAENAYAKPDERRR